MRKLLFGVFAILSLVACNENLDINSSSVESVTKTRSFANQTFSFDSITAPEVWSSFQTLEEMQEACQIPDAILSNLSTEELVQVCMKYPLFGNYAVYNDESIGIKNVMDGFNGFSELKKRTDAAEKLLDVYEKVDIATLSDNKDNYESYPNLRLGYLEMILSSGEIESLYQGESLQRLSRLQEIKVNEKVNENKTSSFSLKHSNLLKDRISKVSLKVRLYTKCGKSFIAYGNSEMSADDIAELNSYAIKTYPNATFISNASATYNCHGYAWSVSDGGKKVWINVGSLSNYWTNDYYSEVTEDKAVKINYYDQESDHSAIASSVPGMYESKWGAGPIMRHAPNYGPYPKMNLRKYYKHLYCQALISCNGTNNGVVNANKDYTYSIYKDVPNGAYVRHRWSIIDGKEDDAIGNGKAAIENDEKNPSAVICIRQPGLYTISCEIYLSTTGEILGNAMYQALVEN